MRKLILPGKKKNFFIVLTLIVLVIILFIIIRLNNKYDLVIELKINSDDIPVLERRLKSIKVNNFRLLVEKKGVVSLYINKADFINCDIENKDVGEILCSNHSYQVFLVDYSFAEELDKYITSDFTYDIDFESILEVPFLEGTDIEKVKKSKTKNNLNEEINLTEIKLTEEGKIKNENANSIKKKLILSFLNGQFWSYSITSNTGNMSYKLHSNVGIIKRFKGQGKKYSFDDIKNIAIFSKHAFNNDIKVLNIEEIKLRSP